MAGKPTGNPNGRPKKPINKSQFETCCAYQCTLEEVCALLGVSDVTLNNWVKENYDGKTFSEVFKEKRELGKMSLRRKQWKLADKNASMAIFLGKNYLGQSDKQEVTVAVVDDDTSKAMEEYFNMKKAEAKTDDQE